MLFYVFGLEGRSFMLDDGRQVAFPPALAWKCAPRAFASACHVRRLQLEEGSIWDHPVGTAAWMATKSFSPETGVHFFALSPAHGGSVLSGVASQLVQNSLLADPPCVALLVGE